MASPYRACVRCRHPTYTQKTVMDTLYGMPDKLKEKMLCHIVSMLLVGCVLKKDLNGLRN